MSDIYQLRDLGEIAAKIREDIKNNFVYDDVSLSQGFKKAFSNNISSGGNSVEFKKTTVVITNAAGQKIYAPNQWFVLASYAVELVREIIKYRNYTEMLLDTKKQSFVKADGSLYEKKDIYKILKAQENEALAEQFKTLMLQYFQSENAEDTIANKNVELLYRFVSDDKWWYGGKGIERTNDFYVSPILGVLNLVNASQAYVATITYAYVNDSALSNELATIVANDECDITSCEDEYKRAADIVSAHISESGLTFEENTDEIQQVYDEFRSRYAPEVLEALSDSELLRSMFYTTESTNDSLCYFLEFEARSRKFCGSIAGGSSYKFGLFQKKDDGIWITGSPSRPEELTDEQALSVGKEIRDALIRGSKIIETASLENLEDYERLDNDLNAALGKYASWGWVHKYFHMLFPNKLSAFHSTDWQKHILYALLIKPSERYFARSGQIAMVSRYANLIYRHMFEACYDKFGGVKKFCRLGTNDREVTYTDEWKKQNVVGIGWNNIGNLEDFVSGNEINRKAVCEKIQEEYYSDNPTLASRKAGEIATFYRSNTDTIFVTMDGHKLLALVDNVGKYYYDADGGMAHKKAGIWHCCFGADESLPNKAAGHMTSCYELTDEKNLMYLYEKYYYDLNEEEEEEVVNQMVEYIEPVYNTDLETEFECNRIVFGAPGTGKSYKLKDDSEKLLDEADGTLERVTFHPDYSYAQFVGTYKPVTDANGDIRYAFVPGPFMRVYVEAIKSGRTDVKPHLLLIEEINRAKVAAVFGDVFQLLDRDDDGVSEYEIQTSEDIRKYLASELGGTPDNWKKIKLPNNMFIWATMNSADQGVFPMDTAFKRRWSFEYLGINQNQEKITGKIVLGGDEEPVVWNRLRKAINDKLAKDYKVNEDKLMGPFFLSKKVIKTDEAGMIADTKKFIDTFKSKVIMYLYEDAAKQHKHKLFSGCDSSKYSSVCDAFEEIGMGIFGEDFKANYYDQQEG